MIFIFSLSYICIKLYTVNIVSLKNCIFLLDLHFYVSIFSRYIEMVTFFSKRQKGRAKLEFSFAQLLVNIFSYLCINSNDQQ